MTVSVPEALREIPTPPCSLAECDTDPGTLFIPPSLPGLGTQQSASPEGLTQLTISSSTPRPLLPQWVILYDGNYRLGFMQFTEFMDTTFLEE